MLKPVKQQIIDLRMQVCNFLADEYINPQAWTKIWFNRHTTIDHVILIKGHIIDEVIDQTFDD